MTSSERMKKWRSIPENRAKERKRNIAARRARGVKPAVRLTDEERKLLRRIGSRRQYRKNSADPAWREQRNAIERAKYAAKKMVEVTIITTIPQP